MTVEALMRQPHFPFPRFLENRAQYELSQDFWQQSFEEGIGFDQSQHAWEAWMNNPFMDGMPVWSAINRTIWRGVSVQQVERSEDPVWFKCWITHTNIEKQKNLPYLFVETFVSDLSHDFFVKAVKSWADQTVSVADNSRLADVLQEQATSDGPLGTKG